MKKEKLHNKLIFGLVAFLFVVCCLGFLYNYLQLKQVAPQNISDRLKELEQKFGGDCTRRAIDGLCFEGEQPALFSVMIDNHVAARPQAGLSKASLVYETVVEAPITRFLAIFYASELPDKIGPIRSARPFFVDWAKEFNASYAHVGGSNQALDLLAKSYNFDLNEMSNAEYFFRDKKLFAPHNTFTSGELLKQATIDKQWQISPVTARWQFTEKPNITDQTSADFVKIKFGDLNAFVEWQYDSKTNDYLRYQSKAIHKDAEGNEIRAKNIIVMKTDSVTIDNYGRLKTTTIGAGLAQVFHNGIMRVATWKRDKIEDPTKFYADNGKEISFLPGTTWIEVVSNYLPDIEVGSFVPLNDKK